MSASHLNAVQTISDPYQPGWVDAPWAALEAVRARSDSPVPAPRSPVADRLAAETALRRLTAGLPDDLALLLSELVRLARLYTELADTEHYHTARLGHSCAGGSWRSGVRQPGDPAAA
jgi:hypothetical protein